jgi:hypothetical protein
LSYGGSPDANIVDQAKQMKLCVSALLPGARYENSILRNVQEAVSLISFNSNSRFKHNEIRGSFRPEQYVNMSSSNIDRLSVAAIIYIAIELLAFICP